jgi:hypothetical protein
MVMDGLTGTVREPGSPQRGVLCWFISPHGLGHAARASAIIAGCSSMCPGIHHHLFTTVPRPFFDESLGGVLFDLHDLGCDVGMVQKTPLVEDVDATLRALEGLQVDGGPGFERVVREVAATGCQLIVSDIAPMGLAVARRLSVPGVLVENFTWDWIYRAYDDPRLAVFGERLGEIFRSAAVRIQTKPVCQPVQGAHTVAPVSRRSQLERNELRSRLGVAADGRLILLSVGGLDGGAIGRGVRFPPATILVAPGIGDRIGPGVDPIRIPSMGGPAHPDLVAASDLVIAKLGYSTVAEVYHAGAALAYLRRPRFPESPILEAFVDEHIPSAALPENWFENPSTTEVLGGLLDISRRDGPRPNGAEPAAELILSALQGRF